MRRVVSAAFIMRHVILMLPLEGLEELAAIKLCPNENKEAKKFGPYFLEKRDKIPVFTSCGQNSLNNVVYVGLNNFTNFE